MSDGKGANRPDHELKGETQAALEEVRTILHGPVRTEALKKAGHLRNAADLAAGLVFAKRGRPRRNDRGIAISSFVLDEPSQPELFLYRIHGISYLFDRRPNFLGRDLPVL